MEIRTRTVGSRGKPLTLWTPLHVIFGILEQFLPVVPLVNGFVGEELSARVI